MNEVEQQKLAEEPLSTYTGDYPGRRRQRLILAVAAAVVVVIVIVGAALFVWMDNRIGHLETTVKAQTRQIHQLQSNVDDQHASLAAVVSCIETAGADQGLCSKLLK